MKKIALFSFVLLLLVECLFGQNQTASTSPYFLIESLDPAIDHLPLKSSKADVNIVGVMADVVISQTYTNEGGNSLNAVYVFPGSTEAAVYGLTMQIGARKIEAEIKEKAKARAAFENAKKEGKRASLLEQHRPNVFQMNVANIQAGETIVVTLRYTEMLKPKDGIYEFVYPTVVGPKYSNGNKESTLAKSPRLKARNAAPFDFDLSVRLATGIPISDIQCKTHLVNIEHKDLQTAQINLQNSGGQENNRDFVLSYQLKGATVESGLLLYEHEDEKFFAMMVQPPKKVKEEEIPAREYIFVVDVSGSMSGFPIQVSKKLLRNLVSNLKPTDQFNIVQFAGSADVLSEESLNASTQNIEEALNMIDRRGGGGGTELLPALNTALALPRCIEQLSRSIIVVTDGYVDVEKEAFDLIQSNLNNTNVFAFGIGGSVNRHLIEGMARIGGGEPFIIEDELASRTEAEKFRKYIQTPVLTRIKTEFKGLDVYDVEPKSIPDVLADRPILIYGKYRGDLTGKIKVKGYTGNSTYSKTFHIDNAYPEQKNSALRYLWARERIKLLDDYRMIERSSENTKEEVTALGLKYNLMTDYTSFVAIDQAEQVASAKKTVSQAIPIPQKVSNSAVGFDLAIKKVVRRSNRSKTGSAANGKKRLTNEELNYLKQIIFNSESEALTCLKEAFSDEVVTIQEMVIDQNGKVFKLILAGKDLEEPIKLCLEEKIKNLLFIDLANTNLQAFQLDLKNT